MAACSVIRYALLACTLAGCGQAWGINKCTEKDGAIVYQDAPCGAASTSGNAVKVWDSALGQAGSPARSSGGWTFIRSEDDMRATVHCGARSPVTYADPSKGAVSKFNPVQMILVVAPPVEAVIVTTADEKTTLHNDVDGMGLKAEPGEFIALTTRVRSDGVSVANALQPALLASLEKASSVRLRLRFWPYERLYDMAPLTMSGFRAALASARQCAKARLKP